MGTYRTMSEAPGRLFPERLWDSGWSLSLQADAAGYACSPRRRLERLEDYETVEAMIAGPFRQSVDPRALDLLPGPVLDKFTCPGPGNGPALGLDLTWDDVACLVKAIDRACLNPNAGIPPGNLGWAGLDVFHGTDQASAADILAHGVNLDASHKGYLGQGFYVAEDADYARSNYADFSGGDGGSVLVMTISESARIIDLRNAEDAKRWTALGLGKLVSADGFARIARLSGVDGCYDRSVGGLAIYNTSILEGVRLLDAAPAPGEP